MKTLLMATVAVAMTTAVEAEARKNYIDMNWGSEKPKHWTPEDEDEMDVAIGHDYWPSAAVTNRIAKTHCCGDGRR
jgi:hypothetical protein